MRKALSLLMIGTSLVTLPALAQRTPTADDDIEEVVVTAARTTLPASALPLTVDVISSADLAQQAAIGGSVVDAVATLVPSFSPTRQKLSGAGETLRGRSPLYAINGIPQSTPLRDGSRDGFTIDPFFVDRVEVIFGSNALQGIGGTGGIVNQVTVDAPKADGNSGRVLVQGSANDGFEADSLGGKAAALLSHRNGRFDATVGAAYETRGAFYDANDRRIGIDSTQGETQDSASTNLFARFGYEVWEGARLDLIASRFELKGEGDYVAVSGNRARNLPGTSVKGTPPGTPAANRTESVALSLTDDDLAAGTLTSQLFFNRSRDTFGGDPAPIATFQDVRLAPLGTLFDQSQNRSRKLGGKIAYERALPGYEDLTGTVGFDAIWDTTEQRLIATGRKWVPPTDFRSLAPFAQLNLALLEEKLRLAGGVRSENARITIDDYTTLASYGSRFVSGGNPTFSDTLWNGGVIVEPVAGLRAYASYAEGYTVPDVGRITRAITQIGIDLDTYLNINPIISNNKEIGIDGDYGPFKGSATYFWSSSKQGQLLVLLNGVYEVQRQRVEIEGLELNLSYETPLPGLTLSGGYAHLRGHADSNNDGKVDVRLDGANISPDRLNLAASYQMDKITARVQAQTYLSGDVGGGSTFARFSGYTVVDSSIRYELPVGGVTLSVQNLLDRQFIDYNSQTQRLADNQRFYAGRGRALTVGWDHSF
ncbi:TonB-dependent receptor [Niveispirillum lacus]|uniref:TonB-dependent receptor n=1 Tax=Niveispirillum lacus TaxID=1981099 RepID=A0A255Z1G2_9PROT|nr:TonB-dependent receptor [Niveispirillum lacus]OYQ34774.1 TonB-dependent receptor [Niveispirillum lacus]